MRGTASTRSAPGYRDDDDFGGFDPCGEGDDGAELGAADGPLADAAGAAEHDGPVSLAEVLRLAQAEAEADAPDALGTASPPAAPAPAADAAPDQVLRRFLQPGVMALAIVPDPDKPDERRAIVPRQDEMQDRTRLAAALEGVGGPLHQLMLSGGKMAQVDVEAARGIAAGLAQGSNDLVVRLESILAATFYTAASRTLGAVGHATEHAATTGRARGVHDLARGAATLTRAFRTTCGAIEVARARERRRNAIPEFVVARIPVESTPEGES